MITLDVSDQMGVVENLRVYDLIRNYDPAKLTVITGQPDGEYDIITDDISDQLINRTSTVQQISYKLNAKLRDDRVGNNYGYCEHSVDTTIVIWVNPIPDIQASTLDSVICNGDLITINITNPNNPIRGTWLYDLDVTPDPGITGASPDQLGIATTLINEALTNNDTTVQKVIYHFTPRIDPDDGGADCLDGMDTTIIIWVNPTPQIRISTDTVICDGDVVTINITNPNIPIRGDWKYDVEVTAEPEIGGESPDQADLDGPTFEETLTNSDTVVHYVDYTFTPKIYNDDGAVVSCPNGIDTTIRIWVNPTPEIRVSATDTVLCTGETTILNITNPNHTVRGDWKYDLTVTADPEIGGEMGNQTGIITALFNETLTNSDSIVHKVEYHFIPRITPDDGGLDCENGRDTTIVIWVNPTPEIRVTADTVICDGDVVTINIRNPNNPIRGDWKYNLVVTPEPR